MTGTIKGSSHDKFYQELVLEYLQQKRFYTFLSTKHFLVITYFYKWKILTDTPTLLYFFHVEFSAANKGQSTVNYCQFLVFDCPNLSCNDHCDQWLFEEIFYEFF